jgi:ABC-type nickel/cobalt efflux system permease component RcnA
MPGHGKALLVSYHLGAGQHLARAALNGALVSLLQVGLAVAIVLLGWPLISRNLQGEIAAPFMERASAVMVLAIGVWLLLTHVLSRPGRPEISGHALAISAGLVPCPVSAFVMIYAIFTGAIAPGVTVVGGYAAGMALTIATFPMVAVAMRGRLLGISWISERHQVLKVSGALAVIALGCWLILFLE